MVAGVLVPYPTSPCKARVPAEKIDFSTEKPVLMSEVEPKPSEGDPARNDKVPVTSRNALLDLPEFVRLKAGVLANRRIGRFAEDRSTHFQSSGSSVPRAGTSCTASKRVFSVTFSDNLDPACNPIFSFKAGRNEGAETLML